MSFFPLSLSFPSIICLISFFFLFSVFFILCFLFFSSSSFLLVCYFLGFPYVDLFFPSLSLPLLYRSSSNIHWHLSKLILHFTKPYAKGRWKQVLDEMRIEKKNVFFMFYSTIYDIWTFSFLSRPIHFQSS